MEVEVIGIILSERVTAANGKVYLRVENDEESNQLQWFPITVSQTRLYSSRIALEDHHDLEQEYGESRLGYYEIIEDTIKTTKKNKI